MSTSVIALKVMNEVRIRVDEGGSAYVLKHVPLCENRCSRQRLVIR